LQLDTSETRYGVDPADTSTPEQLFEKQWALTLLETVLDRLRQEFVRAGKAELFQTLEPCLIGSRDKQPYAELAAQMGMSEAAVKMAVYRLRDRYRLILKEEVGRTVALPSDVDEELRHLFRVLSRG
jgi:RNA polymerase sigma-70 factor (ECF subfamily)